MKYSLSDIIKDLLAKIPILENRINTLSTKTTNLSQNGEGLKSRLDGNEFVKSKDTLNSIALKYEQKDGESKKRLHGYVDGVEVPFATQNSVLVPNYGNATVVYNKGEEHFINSQYYNYAGHEYGVGEKVYHRSHNWLGYWETDPVSGNYSFYFDYKGAASYTIPQDGYVNFSYVMTSWYTTAEKPWKGYDASKDVSFGTWLVRDENIIKVYEKSGLAGVFSDDGLIPVAQGDVLYYGVLNKGAQLPASAEIKFYPAKIKKLS